MDHQRRSQSHRHRIPTNTLTEGLLAYWPANEASGDLLDAHTRGAHLTENGAVTADTGLIYSTAREVEAWAAPGVNYFDGSHPALITPSDHDLTVCLAFMVYSIGPGATDYQALFRQNYSNGGTALKVAYTENVAWQAWQRDPALLQTVHSEPTNIVVDTWYWLRASIDLANSLLRIVIDESVDDHTAALLNFKTYPASTPTYVFYDTDGGHGRIGPVILWNRCLSDAEGARVYNAGTPLTYAQLIAAGG